MEHFNVTDDLFADEQMFYVANDVDEIFRDLDHIGVSVPANTGAWNPLDFAGLTDLDTSSELPEDIIEDIFRGAWDRLALYGITWTGGRGGLTIAGAEAGDDRVDICRNPLLLAVMLDIQSRVLKMSTSEKDTFISDRYYNFCEVTCAIPCAFQQSLDYAQKDNFRTIGFVDVPALRVVLDVKKGDMGSHSSTVLGKSTMLGVKRLSCNPKFKLLFEIATYLQDGNLSSHTMEEPKYIPVEMGGCGVPPSWGEFRNLYLYLYSYKRGTYARVYGTATNEAREVIKACDAGNPSETHLCRFLRMRQEYLHGTYANVVLVPPLTQGKRREEMPPPIYKAQGVRAGVSGVEKRLVRAKRLLTEEDARTEFDRNVRLSEILMGWKSISSTVREEERKTSLSREKFGGALRANSAFQRLLDRQANGTEVESLIRDGFRLVTGGVTGFSMMNARYLAGGAKGEIYSLHDLPFSSDMFLREEVSREKSLRIPNLVIRPVTSTGRRTVRTVSKLGLWQISSTMEEWADDTIDLLLDARKRSLTGTVSTRDAREILSRNPEWVSDDKLIVARMFEDCDRGDIVAGSTVVLVSTDIRLARQAAQTCDLNVVLVDPKPVFILLGLGEVDHETRIEPNRLIAMFEEDWFPSRTLREPEKVYIDSGSAKARLKDLALDGFGKQVTAKQITLVEAIQQPRSARVVERKLNRSGFRIGAKIFRANTVSSENPVFLSDSGRIASEGWKPPFGNFNRWQKKFLH